MSRLLAIVVMVLLMTVLVTSEAFAQEAAPEEGARNWGARLQCGARASPRAWERGGGGPAAC
jgi:hypothetical protein